MESREIFLKGEIRRLKQLLNVVYVHYPYNYDYEFDNEKRFQRIVSILFEIKEMLIKLKDISKGRTEI